MKIGIIGLGLIGGSIAKAARAKIPGLEIVAAGRNEHPLRSAKESNIINRFTTEIDHSFEHSDIIFICVPVSHIAQTAKALSAFTTESTIVTDVGSTKQKICADMTAFKNKFTFIGGHPMTGSEQSGYFASSPHLFENAYYVITPDKFTENSKRDKLFGFVKALGAIPIAMEPENHDFSVAAISHIPHVVAMSLVNTVKSCCKESDSPTKTLASGGFKDITRIASSSPKMWQDISVENKANILNVLTLFKESLAEYENCLKNSESDSIFNLFSEAKTFRDDFSSTKLLPNMPIIRVDAVDKPGVIAEAALAFSDNGINIKNIGIVNNREYENGVLEIVVESEGDKRKGELVLEKGGFKVY